MKHCYIDTETTGLNPAKHEIIEIAIITENEDGTFERWHTKIKPDHIENAHPKALEVNGYTPEAWEGAPNFEDVVPEITSRLKGSILVGHNVNFDIRFIEALLDKANRELEISHRGTIDTITLVREHLLPTGLPSPSLDKTRRWLGWSLEGAHSALKDAEDCMRLRHTLERSTWLQRQIWGFLGSRRFSADKTSME